MKNKNIYRFIFCVQFIWLVYVLILCLLPNNIYYKSAEELFNNQINQEYRNGVFKNEAEDQSIEVATETFAVKSGCYEVQIEYDAKEMNDATKVNFIAEDVYKGVLSSTVTLDSDYQTATDTLWVRMGANIKEFRAIINSTGKSEFQIKSISLHEKKVYRLIRFIGYLLLFGIIDFFLLLLFPIKKGINSNIDKKVVFLLSAIILFSSLPCFTNFLFYGHDLPYHLQRIISLARAIKEGFIPHRIQFEMINGYGYASPLFYGELLLFIPALLYNMYVPLQLCYQLFIILCNAVTCVICYVLGKSVFKNKNIAITGAFLYTCAAYRLSNIYIRAAVGEYTAMIFLPIVVYIVWIIFQTDTKSLTLKHLTLAVVVFSGLIQTHILSCEMTALFIAVICLFQWRKIFVKSRLVFLVKTFVVTLLTNLWFLYPLLDSMRMELELTKSQDANRIESCAAYPLQIFSVFHTGYGIDTFTGVKGEMPLTIGVTLVLCLALSIIVFILSEKWNIENTTEYKVAKILFFLGVIALFMSCSYMRWDNFYNSWNPLLKILTAVQFPWRYLQIATVLIVCLGLICISIFYKKLPREKVTQIICTLWLLGILTTGHFCMQFANETSEMIVYSGTAVNTMEIGAGREYLLANTDIELMRNREISTSDGMKVNKVEYQYGKCTFECVNSQNEEGYIDIPVLAYDNYKAYTKDGNELEITLGNNNCIRVLIPPNDSEFVKVFYKEPIAWRVCEVISFLTIFSLLVVNTYVRSKKDAK